MSETNSRRSLNRHERALAYGLLGWVTEIVFTAVDDARDPMRRNAKLEGHTYLWMLPIYGSAAWLFEPLHNATRHRPVWQRALQYAAGITAVEFATGMALKRFTGTIPWDYTGRSRTSIKGATRLDYLPLWGVAGLVMERYHDKLSALPLRAVQPARLG